MKYEKDGEMERVLKKTALIGKLEVMRQALGNNLCAYYVCENIRMTTSERSTSDKALWMQEKRDKLLPADRV